jgi:hypothetical protein
VPGKELESAINDGIRPLVGDEVRGTREEAAFHLIGIGSVILQHTIRLEQVGMRRPIRAPPSVAIAACVEGLILHNIARHDDADPHPTFDLVVKAAPACVPMNAVQ